MPAADIIVGARFGRLTVVGLGERQRDRPAARCKCECGQETIVRLAQLASGQTQSCGCFRSELSKAKARKRFKPSHGRLTARWND